MKRASPSVRWGVEQAAAEFGINPRTLSGSLRRNSLEPGEDGKFSTSQICSAIFGDREAEELRKIREEADKVALHNAEKRGSLIELAVVERAWEDIVLAAKTRISLIPAKAQSRLGLNEDQTKQLEREVDEALDEIAKPPDYKSEGAEEGDEPDA